MKKTKNKNLRRGLSFLALAALVAGLAAMPLLTADKVPEAEFPVSILSAKAEHRELLTDLRSGGVLSEEEAVTVTVPAEVKLTGFLVKNGDAVKEGDPIATVDRVTVMSAIAAAQEAMEDLAAKLEKERGASSTDTLKAPGGLVKKVYAQPGDRAEDVMREYGALATLSLDGLMKLELTLEAPLPEGRLTVEVEGQTLNAAVTGLLDGTVTVTFQDKGFEDGAETVLLDSEGRELGRGSCEIHAPWNAVAYSGTVSYVNAREDRSLHEGAVILGLKDIPYSAEYRSLAAQHRGYEEQMLELFTLYQTLTLTAPCDGIVSGIDENSAQLLKAEEGWSVSLLKNAPGADPDAEYINFVGQVLNVEGNGKVTLQVNPSPISIPDYTDLSNVPLNTAAMTEEIEVTLGVTVYKWNPENKTEGDGAETEGEQTGGEQTGGEQTGGEQTGGEQTGGEQTGGEQTGGGQTGGEQTGGGQTGGEQTGGGQTGGEQTETAGWVISGYAAGDILLFAGQVSDSFTGIVWAVHVGRAALPEGWVQDPDSGGNGSGGGRPGWSGSLPGGITIPSFGGYSGYTDIPQEPTVTAPTEVTVASVTPQDTMTLEMPVDELDLHLVRVGQEAQVALEALGKTFPATVTSVGRTGQSLGGNSKFTVELTLARQTDMLPGMNGAVSIPLETVSGIAIPTAALAQNGSRCFVYTALDPKTGEPTAPLELRTGRSDGEYVLIEGLEEGAEIFYSYYEALKE